MSFMTHRHRKEREAKRFASRKSSPKAKTVETETPQAEVEPTEETKEEQVEKPPYTKSDINRMPVDELKKVATEIGIEGADEKTGGELKKLIIEKLGL